MRDFKKEIQELLAGTIKEIQVTKEEMMDFRQAWLASDDKSKIVGQAELDGLTVYRCQ